MAGDAIGVRNATWDGLDASALARECGVPVVELLDETSSTLDVAHEMAERGAPAGTLVLADMQRAGRGRLGRSWTSDAGRGVWCTVIERPGAVPEKTLDVLSLRVGLFIAESLDDLAAGTVGVKWPNDLMLPATAVRPGKLGGILVESRWPGGGARPAWIAIGAGVNVIAPPPESAPEAGALPAGVRRGDVLRRVVRSIRAASAASGPLSEGELSRFAGRDVLRGRLISEPVRGRVVGIASGGELVVDTAGGEQLCRTGTIRLAEDK